MIATTLPHEFLAGHPTHKHPEALARLSVMESLRLPFQDKVLGRIALHDGDWSKELLTTFKDKFGEGGLNRADIEITAEGLDVFDLVFPEYTEGL
jgi:hypothetical protein